MPVLKYEEMKVHKMAETIDRREFCRYLERWCSEPNDWTGWGSAAAE